MRALRSALEPVRLALMALLVSALPEREKSAGRPAAYASVAAHIVSGWVETFASAALFIVGLLRFTDRFNNAAGWTYVQHRPTLTYGDFFGVGVIGYLSYLLTPVAWVTVWCFGEGIVRALDAALSSRLLGMALVSVPWRAVRGVRAAGARRALIASLGPERPDEVVEDETASVPLVLLTSREKPWAANQVIEFRHEFFRAVRKRLVRHGGRSAFRYDFRRLDHGEVIRGVLVRYDPGEPTDAQGDPVESPAP